MQRASRSAEENKLCETLRSPCLCVGKFTPENKIFTNSSTDGHRWEKEFSDANEFTHKKGLSGSLKKPFVLS
jgi:hypothetical protein